MHPEEDYAIRSFRLGANGYLAKSSVPEELMTAVRKVTQGEKYISPRLSEKLINDYIAPKPLKKEVGLLSHREYQILSSLAQGKKLTEIASDMSLSVKTVSTYRSRLMKKLGLSNTAQLIRYAMQRGMS